LKAHAPIISQKATLTLNSASKALRGCERYIVRGSNAQDKVLKDKVGLANFKKAAKKEFKVFIKKYLTPINLKDVNK